MRPKPIRLSHAVKEYFRSDRMAEKADATRANRARTLVALTRHCGPNRAVTDLTAADFEATIDELRRPATGRERAEHRGTRGGRAPRSGRNGRSLNIDRASLRLFVAFLHDRGYLPRTADPSAGLRNDHSARQQGAKREPLKPLAAAELLDVAGRYHPRERAGIALALLGGLRESEIVNLTWGHVVWHARGGPVLDFPRPKSRNDAHRVAISPALERELRDWHAWYSRRHPEMRGDWYVIPAKRRGSIRGRERRSDPMNSEWPIVPDRRTWGLLSSVKHLLTAVGVTDMKGKGMHTLRRTFADMLQERTGDIRIVQNALGHASQLTTEIYMDRNREYETTATALRGWTDPFGTGVVADADDASLPDNVRPLRRKSAG